LKSVNLGLCICFYPGDFDRTFVCFNFHRGYDFRSTYLTLVMIVPKQKHKAAERNTSP
jgi:hypothetical protein